MSVFAMAGLSQRSGLRSQVIAVVLAVLGAASTADASPMQYTFSYAPKSLSPGDSGYHNQVLTPLSFSFVLNSEPGPGYFALPALISLDVESRSTSQVSFDLDTGWYEESVGWRFLSTSIMQNALYFDSFYSALPEPGTYTFSSVRGSALAGTSLVYFDGTGALTVEDLSTSIPEPSTGSLALLALAGMGFAAAARARRRQGS